MTNKFLDKLGLSTEGLPVYVREPGAVTPYNRDGECYANSFIHFILEHKHGVRLFAGDMYIPPGEPYKFRHSSKIKESRGEWLSHCWLVTTDDVLIESTQAVYQIRGMHRRAWDISPFLQSKKVVHSWLKWILPPRPPRISPLLRKSILDCIEKDFI